MEGAALLVNLTVALVAATIGALVAVRLRQSAILGYIVAGIVIGPFTPGFVGDLDIVRALADIGIVFLMFAIGNQVRLADLLRVGPVAGIGGTIQVVATIGIGYGVGRALGWGDLEAFIFGAVLSNSSSTILARILGERGESDMEHAHVSLSWSTVQDLGTIVLVVLIGALATTGEPGADLVIALGQAVVFLVVVLPLGLRVVPRVLEILAGFRNRELFVLGVVTLALGTALLASAFGISLALGAFVAGLVIGESDLSQEVLGETRPFRDLFAGLFFVSIGMLVDPAFVAMNLPLLLLVVVLIVLVKGTLVAILTAAFRYPARTAILTGITLAQSAEFSFLLARQGADLGIVSPEVFSLMLSGAAASIVLAPALHQAGVPIVRWWERRSAAGDAAAPTPGADDGGPARRTVVICGYGRVGRLVGATLDQRGFRYVVIEEDPRVVRDLRERGVTVLRGSAENRAVLEQAPLASAAVLVVAVPDPLVARQVVANARRDHPWLPIVVRTHSGPERDALRRLGATEVVNGETELGLEMTRFTLRRLGLSGTETQAIVQGIRGREHPRPGGGPPESTGRSRR
jgi:CPA2 family monovalent cation:H+ antiporter-2